MPFCFQTPSIHQVADVTAKAQTLTTPEGRPFAWIEFTFHDEAGTETSMGVYFPAKYANRAHEIAAAIELSKHPLQQAAE